MRLWSFHALALDAVLDLSLLGELMGPLALFTALLFLIPAWRSVAATPPDPLAVVIDGELKRWHPITLTLDGPTVSEGDAVNPFLDYRFEVTFSRNGVSYVVPGYFAADGNAAETSATTGKKWRAHFVPDKTGTWTYAVSFRAGADVAIADDPSAGTPTAFDGLTGSFTVAETNKTGRDFRARGMLRYVGSRYMQFDSGAWFVESGSGSPENFLADPEFDGTYAVAGDHLKTYSAHLQDWNAGDPSWKGGKGKGIIGAVNYLADQGVNSFFFLTMNAGGGDGKDVWPWTSDTERFRFDVSKLAQWEILFTHMNENGILLHVVLQELGNEFLLDNGDLGRERRLYYREIIARFAHHSLKWNLGEEHKIEGIGNTDAQRQAYVAFISENDPYQHPITMHSQSGTIFYDAIYGPLLGNEHFSGMSLQVHNGDLYVAGNKTYKFIKEWVVKSTANGHPWLVTLDECCGWNVGVKPDGSNMDSVRVSEMWGSLMAGGAGFDWYLGFTFEFKYDLNVQDFHPYEFLWRQSSYAASFFHKYLPFNEMAAQTGLTPETKNRVFAKPGSLYVVYLPNGGTTTLDLGTTAKTYPIQWFNPRTGGSLQAGSKTSVSGPGIKSLGTAPVADTLDWVAIVGVPLDNDDPGAHLPVELAHFSGFADGPAIELTWQTVSETNNAGFEVERRIGDTFQSVEFVPGHGTTDEPITYRLRLPQNPAGSHNFRLKQIDFDGTFSHSPVVTIEVGITGDYVFSAAAPNPFNPTTQFTLAIGRAQRVAVDVFDMLGRRVAIIHSGALLPGEAHPFRYDAAGLPSGIYLIRATGEYFSASQRVVLLK